MDLEIKKEKRREAMVRYLESNEFKVDMADYIEQWIEDNPSDYEDIVVDVMVTSIDCKDLMTDAAEFGRSLRDAVNDRLADMLEEEVANEWAERMYL
jgi:predicted RNA-binding protein YlxR (DUF448 family)